MDQVEYLGRWVDKEHFRVFVYNDTGQKLVNSYDEFKALIGSGLWFPTKDGIEIKVPNATSLEVEIPKDELKTKRKKAKNQFRQATSLGK